jgi:hypothetical protein
MRLVSKRATRWLALACVCLMPARTGIEPLAIADELPGWRETLLQLEQDASVKSDAAYDKYKRERMLVLTAAAPPGIRAVAVDSSWETVVWEFPQFLFANGQEGRISLAWVCLVRAPGSPEKATDRIKKLLADQKYLPTEEKFVPELEARYQGLVGKDEEARKSGAVTSSSGSLAWRYLRTAGAIREEVVVSGFRPPDQSAPKHHQAYVRSHVTIKYVGSPPKLAELLNDWQPHKRFKDEPTLKAFQDAEVHTFGVTAINLTPGKPTTVAWDGYFHGNLREDAETFLERNGYELDPRTGIKSSDPAAEFGIWNWKRSKDFTILQVTIDEHFPDFTKISFRPHTFADTRTNRFPSVPAGRRKP